MVMAPLAPGQLPADARRRAATLVDQGRFTQAAQLLDSALVQEPTAADSAVVRGLRLDLASALLLGGDYRRALREYEQLLGDLQRAVPPDHELINHCRFQAGICQVEVGETTVALRGFRALLTDEQRRHGPLDPQVLELRRQVGLLTASSGDVDTAVHALGALRDDLERVLGSVHPEVHDVQRIIHHLLSLRD
jgi:tetratricopeptide (TPR) repeat protein